MQLVGFTPRTDMHAQLRQKQQKQRKERQITREQRVLMQTVQCLCHDNGPGSKRNRIPTRLWRDGPTTSRRDAEAATYE